MDTGSIVVIGLNVAWLVPFVYFMGRMMRRAAKERDERAAILATGIPAEAGIVKVNEVGPYYKRVPHLVLSLRVHMEGQAPFDATVKGFFRQIDFPRFQPGARVEVRVDPATRRVAVVGDQLM
ncbi:MAG: hypothetical protein JST00_07580 [Deltaproteobacteria bacterium]|nr:hypothetical protein [Deltaproteobacteria bacterium]